MMPLPVGGPVVGGLRCRPPPRFAAMQRRRDEGRIVAMPADFTSFADLLSARIRDGSRVSLRITEDWLQGRTAFGGLTAAIAVQAMRDVAGAVWPTALRLRALQTHFIGPVAAGVAEVDVQVLRQGKSVLQVQAKVLCRGELAALLVGVFGSPRASTIETLTPRQPPVRCSADDAPKQPFVRGLLPAFLQHVEVGWADGDPPYSGGTGWGSSLYLRLLDDRVEALDRDVLTVLLADAPPPPALGRLSRPVPASTVCWALELLPISAPVAGTDWWRIDSQGRSASGGFANHSATLWAPTGEVAAFGHQVVTIYA
jgi:hypothetical protein